MNNHCGNNKKHMFLMVICCAVPLLVLGAFNSVRNQGTLSGGLISFGAILLCPLMHLGMMYFMHKDKKEGSKDDKPSCH